MNQRINTIISFVLSISLFVGLNATMATDGTSSAFSEVTLDDTIQFNALLHSDGSVETSWSPYSHGEDFTYYKVIRSQTNDNPVYPEDGYIYYSSDQNQTAYTDKDAPKGTNYYRVCHIAAPERYCSKTVMVVEIDGDANHSQEVNVEDEVNAEETAETESEQTEPTTETSGIFTDLPSGHWSESCVQKLMDKGIVSGDPSGTFRPDDNVNRAEFIKMMIMAIYPELKDNNEKNCYNDVNETDWFAGFVCAADSKNIVQGYDGNLFKPSQNMTRAEATAVLVKTLGLPVSANAYAFFNDVTVVWQIEYINAAYQADLVSGYSDNTFRPDNNVSRAEAAQLVCNALATDVDKTVNEETNEEASDQSNEETSTEETTEPQEVEEPAQTPPEQTDAIIIDHTTTDLSQIPTEYIEAAKDMYSIAYGHTSHGSQITTGMEGLKGDSGSLYYFTSSGVGGLLYNESLLYGDLGSEGSTDWYDQTRDMLDSNSHINMVMWSWCGGVSDMTSSGINQYLTYMNQLEEDYPNVTFVYMTGHLDGSGEEGNLHIRNEQIRNYALNNDKILFDFADIESYNPGGEYFLDNYATDGNEYDSNGDGNPWGDANWATEWCDANPGSELCAANSCAHSTSLNCNLKGRAFWWMMARLAGWNGN